MQQQIDGLILKDEVLRPLVEAASSQLDSESEGTALPARASWFLGPHLDASETGRPPVWVSFEDETGEYAARAIPFEDLANPHYRRHAVNHLWDAVLGDRFRRLMRRIEPAAEAVS